MREFAIFSDIRIDGIFLLQNTNFIRFNENFWT